MDDKFITKVSLAVSIIGIAAIFLISYITAPDEIKISNITMDSIGKEVSISGQITSFRSQSGTTFLTMENEGKINVVIFDTLDTDSKKGKNATVIGKVTLYKGNIEIIASKIKVL